MATADTRSRDLKLYSDAQLNTILNLQLDKKRALEVQYDEYLDYSLDRYMEHKVAGGTAETWRDTEEYRELMAEGTGAANKLNATLEKIAELLEEKRGRVAAGTWTEG